MKTITTTKYIKNPITFLLVLLISAFSFAQEEKVEEEKKSKLKFGGSVDGYYRTNFLNAPTFDDATGELLSSTPDPGTAFANQTGFAVGMGNLIASYEGSKVGAVLDLVVGPRGAGATFSNDIVDGIVNQAYVYWNVSEKTTLTMGRFNTFLGYEVIAPQANFNYSTSYLFSNGPFSHVGLKADFSLSEDMSLMLGIMNPWDTNDVTATGEYSFGAQLGFKDQYLNFYYDSGENGGLGTEIDFTGGFDLSDSFFLGINAAYNANEETDSGFYGLALYPQIATSDSFAVGLRGEYFVNTLDGFEDVPITALTLTGSYTIENLIIKPEFRIDSYGNDFEPFLNNDGDASAGLSSFLLAAIYSF